LLSCCEDLERWQCLAISYLNVYAVIYTSVVLHFPLISSCMWENLLQ
jgi:hypothetical protein